MVQNRLYSRIFTIILAASPFAWPLPPTPQASSHASKAKAPKPKVKAPSKLIARKAGYLASVSAIPGATYTWASSSGIVAEKGMDTPTLTFTAGNGSSANLVCRVTVNGKTGTGKKKVKITPCPDAAITAPSAVNASGAPVTASVRSQSKCTYTWGLMGGRILSDNRKPQISYILDTPGKAYLTCSIRNKFGVIDSKTKRITVWDGLSTITGSQHVTYRSFDALTGKLIPSDDLSYEPPPNTSVEAVLSTGTRIPAVWSSSARAYTIPGVPTSEPFWLVYNGRTYILTTETSIDLGWDVPRRLDALMDRTGTILPDISDMTPWKEGDALSFIETNNAYNNDLYWFSDYLSEGDTHFGGDQASFNTKPYISVSRGDSPRFIHHSALPVPNPGRLEAWHLATEEFAPTEMIENPSGELITRGSFKKYPLDTTYHFFFKQSELNKYRNLNHPNASVDSFEMYFLAAPGASTLGVKHTGFNLASFSNEAGDTETDFHLDAIQGARPPLGYEILAVAREKFRASYKYPGSDSENHIVGENYIISTNLPTEHEPLKPLLTPARRILINGKPIQTEQINVGTRPTLSWDPPELNSPSGYKLYLYEITSNEDLSDTNIELVNILYLQGHITSIELPEGMLVPGRTYAIRLRAYRTATPNPTLAPLRSWAPDAGCADALSAMFRP